MKALASGFMVYKAKKFQEIFKSTKIRYIINKGIYNITNVKNRN